uniref:Uncharacterized protein n=1 Tax=Rousettus aegyptiacus TaxID=9407 RepID=A0A7J8EK12_ROUAE|nr:hypothetical protein HJG63_012570 [Rousettus aegyptiacus]
MGNFFSEQTENWEEMSPGSYDPDNLSMEDEMDLGDETNVNIEEPTITMEEPPPAPRENENKEVSRQTNNRDNEEVLSLVKTVRSALRQNAKNPKKGGRQRTILVFYYRKKKQQNQHLPERKEETPQNSGNEKNDL